MEVAHEDDRRAGDVGEHGAEAEGIDGGEADEAPIRQDPAISAAQRLPLHMLGHGDAAFGHAEGDGGEQHEAADGQDDVDGAPSRDFQNPGAEAGREHRREAEHHGDVGSFGAGGIALEQVPDDGEGQNRACPGGDALDKAP